MRQGFVYSYSINAFITPYEGSWVPSGVYENMPWVPSGLYENMPWVPSGLCENILSDAHGDREIE